MVAGLDQAVKAVAVYFLSTGAVPVIPGFFDLVLVYNRGAAFGIFSRFANSHLLLIGMTLLALAVAAWVALGSTGKNRQVLICIGLIMGGALGNLIDRLRLGSVVDFFYLHAGSFHWPAFNVADIAISLAGVYLALLLLRGKL